MAEKRLEEPGFERLVSRESILSVLQLHQSPINRVRDSMNYRSGDSLVRK